MLLAPASVAQGVPRQSLVAETIRPVLDALERPVKLHFSATVEELPEIIGALGVPTRVNRRELDAVGLGQEAPVTVDVQDIPLRSALDAMLRPLDLTWIVRDGLLVITTRNEEENTLDIRTYDVRDLAPKFVYRGERLIDFDSLIDLITATVAPNSWNEVGGPGSIRTYQNGDTLALVVSQTFHNHYRLDLLLRQLREQRGLPKLSATPGQSVGAELPPPRKRAPRRDLDAPAWTRGALRR
jgi:hypothetical protein